MGFFPSGCTFSLLKVRFGVRRRDFQATTLRRQKKSQRTSTAACATLHTFLSQSVVSSTVFSVSSPPSSSEMSNTPESPPEETPPSPKQTVFICNEGFNGTPRRGEEKTLVLVASPSWPRFGNKVDIPHSLTFSFRDISEALRKFATGLRQGGRRVNSSQIHDKRKR